MSVSPKLVRASKPFTRFTEETDMLQPTVFTADRHVPPAVGCPAKTLTAEQRQQLAVEALAGSFTITALASQVGVSRKFVYQQMATAQQVLQGAFAPPPPDDDVLF